MVLAAKTCSLLHSMPTLRWKYAFTTHSTRVFVPACGGGPIWFSASLDSTDVWTIHAGYTRNREELLRRGVELFEWRVDGQSCGSVIDNSQLDCADFLYSLHAKSVVFDRETIFVGSFNLNPRSRLLNTETALIIKSSELAQQIAEDISLNMLPVNSWRLDINNAGDLQWHGMKKGEPEIKDHEPDTSAMTRFKASVAAKLPLEKYW